jgi:hypothetical protein
MAQTAQVAPATGGLFTQAQSAPSPERDKRSLNDLLTQLENGEGIQFDAKAPIALANTKYTGGNGLLDHIISTNGADNVFFISVEASLDPAFIAKIKKVVDPLAATRLSVSQRNSLPALENNKQCDKIQGAFNVDQAVLFLFSERAFKRVPDGSAADMDGYLFEPNKLVDVVMVDSALDILSKRFAHPVDRQSTPPTLDVLILGDNESVLQKEQHGVQPITSRIFLEQTDWIRDYRDAEETAWMFIVPKTECGFRALSIVERRSFILALAIDPAALAQAKKITVKIAN